MAIKITHCRCEECELVRKQTKEYQKIYHQVLGYYWELMSEVKDDRR